jgi:DNA-binding transcriptional LysR family regulator
MNTLLALVRERLGVTVVPELALAGADGLAIAPVTPPDRRVLRLVPAAEDVSPAVQALLIALDRVHPTCEPQPDVP